MVHLYQLQLTKQLNSLIMSDLEKLSSKELALLLAKKREEERELSLNRRKAYESIREKFLQEIETRVSAVANEVSGFHKFMHDETETFRAILAEYGELRTQGQLSYTVKNDTFKVAVKSNKVKCFDERADVAAARLVEFLLEWVKKTPEGTENLMYQLAMTLLERNKNGDLDYKSISKLYEMEERFNSVEYTSIMNLFRESNIVEGNAINFYFFRKDSLGVWRKIEPSFNRL
jgi:hypothetical protein